MPGGIYLIQDDGRLVRLEESAYDSEVLMHQLLAQYPDLLAGDQMDSLAPRRWLLVEREAAIPIEEGGAEHFALDHLFLDQDGVPTLVEVKRSTDTRIRREVVGQMLDYAANAAAYWPVERMRAAYEQRCEAQGIAPEQDLADALGEELDYEAFWQTVRTNLLAKRIRLVFVADHIPPELRRIVEFLNETMSPVEVLAVEVQQFVGQSHKALVPRVIGQTARAQQAKGTGSRPKTDRETFLATWAPPQRALWERLLKFAAERDLAINWGTKGFSMNVVLDGGKVSILEGYPPDICRGMFIPLSAIRHKVRDSEPIVKWYRGELLRIPAMEKTGKGLRCTVAQLDVAGERRLYEALEGVVQRVRESGPRE